MKITITKTKEGLGFKTQGSIDFNTMMEMLCTTTYNVMKQFQAQAPEEKRQQLTDIIYDHYNETASTILTMFDPQREMRPDLTADAILVAQNDIMKYHITQQKRAEKKKKKSQG